MRRSLVNLVLAGSLTLGGCSWVPSLAQEKPPVNDPVATLTGHPAPIVSFESDSFFLVNKQVKAGTRLYEFVRDCEQAESAPLALAYRVAPKQTLRGYEKSLLKGREDDPSREVHYRSQRRLVHTLLTNSKEYHEFRLMDWRLERDGVHCCELTFRAPIQQDEKAFLGEMQTKHRKYLRDLEIFCSQAPALVANRLPQDGAPAQAPSHS